MTRADCGTILLFEASPGNDPEPTSDVSAGLPGRGTAYLADAAGPGPAANRSSSRISSPTCSVPHMQTCVRHWSRRLCIRAKTWVSSTCMRTPPNFFDQSALDTLQTLALQAAIALGNARRFQEQSLAAEQLKNRATALTHLAEITSTANFERPLEKSLLAIASAIQQATPFQIALLSVYEPESGLLQRWRVWACRRKRWRNCSHANNRCRASSNCSAPSSRSGHSYFIPADQTPVIPADVHSVVPLSRHEQDKDREHLGPGGFPADPARRPAGTAARPVERGRAARQPASRPCHAGDTGNLCRAGRTGHPQPAPHAGDEEAASIP